MIVLKSLKAKNFKSWQALEIDNINELNLTLIQAPNGAGKTSIKNIIEYLLLDTFDDISVSDIPYNKDTQCTIEGVFQKDNDEITIIKYRNHKKKGQAIELWLNDSDSLTHTDRRDTQKEIFRLFDIDIFTVQATSIYSSESKSFIKSTDSEKKEIIYNVLNLHKYNKGKENAKQKVKELSKVIEDSELTITNIKDTINNQEEDLKVTVEELGLYEKEREQKKKVLSIDLSNIVYESTNEHKKTIFDLEKQKVFEDTKRLKEVEGILDTLKAEKPKQVAEFKHLVDQVKIQKEELKTATEKMESYEEKKQVNIKSLVDSLEDYEIKPMEYLGNKISGLENQRMHIDDFKISLLESDLSDYKLHKVKKETELQNNKTKLKDAGDGKCPVIENHKCDLLIEQRDSIIKSCNPIIKSIEKDIDSVKGLIGAVVDALDEWNEAIGINKIIDKEIEVIKTEMDETKAANNINENNIEHTISTIEKLKEETNPYIAIVDNIKIPEESEIEAQSFLVGTITNTITGIEKEICELNRIIEFNTKIQNKIQEYQSKIDAINIDTKIKFKDEINIKENIERIRAETNPHMLFKCRIEKKIKANQHSIYEKEKDISKVLEELSYYKFWLTGFGKTGLPNLLSENFLISLEDETNRILSSISDQMHITISSQKENKDKSITEKIDIQVHHPDKTITSVGAYSAGQVQRVKLANLFALHHLISNLDFVFLDEILEGSLDREGKEAIIELLKVQAKDIGTVFIVSHDDTISDSFENIINIEMTNGVSYIKGDG